MERKLPSDTFFFSTKIHKIRWLNTPFVPVEGGYRGVLAIGSYDEEVWNHIVNNIKLIVITYYAQLSVKYFFCRVAFIYYFIYII